MKKIAVNVGKTIAVLLIMAMVVIAIEWVRELWVANEFNKENTYVYSVKDELIGESTVVIPNSSTVCGGKIPINGFFNFTKEIGVNHYEISKDGSLASMPTFFDAGETILSLAYPILEILGDILLPTLLYFLIISPVFIFAYFMSKEPDDIKDLEDTENIED